MDSTYDGKMLIIKFKNRYGYDHAHLNNLLLKYS